MAGLKLSEASNLMKTPLKSGVIQTIVRESAVLELLPFVNLQGNAYSFAQESDAGTVGFREVNTDYDHTNPTYQTKTENLKLLGSKVEVDRFNELTQNIHDIRAQATIVKSKAIANEFTRVFFKGDSSVNHTEFDGLDKRANDKQIVDAQGFQMHTGLLHQVIDKVDNGASVLFMNKRTRREVTSLFMAQNTFINTSQDEFGRPQKFFGGVRIAVVEDSVIPDNSVYAVQLGGDTGVSGIQNGELSVVDNGLRGTTFETLIEWYVSIVDTSPTSFAVLKNFGFE